MSKSLSEETPGKVQAAQGYGVRQLFRRPPPVNDAVLHIKVFPDANYPDAEPAVVGDGMFIFAVAEDMDALSLSVVEMYVTTVSSSGLVRVQVRNITQAQDMLSTRISVDASELNSKTAATPVVINTANAQVAWADEISIDVDDAGTNAYGLGMILAFGSA